MLAFCPCVDNAVPVSSSSLLSRCFRLESHSSDCSTHMTVMGRMQASRFWAILTTLNPESGSVNASEKPMPSYNKTPLWNSSIVA